MENRRAGRADVAHQLSVFIVDGPRLEVRCLCGKVVGGQRKDDGTCLSLMDFLELVRLHSSTINSRR